MADIKDNKNAGCCQPHEDLDALVEEMKAKARAEAGLPAGTPVVITGGVPLAAPGQTNWFQSMTL